MKHFFPTQALIASIILIGAQSAHAFAATNPSAKAAPSRSIAIKSRKSDTVKTSASAPAPAAATGSTRWGLGIASSTNAILTNSISSIHLIDDDNAIQTYFGIKSTSPFTFGMGGVYKHTVAGTKRGGLHVGGGLGLGTVGVTGGVDGSSSEFFISFLGNVGLHFTVPNVDQLLISLDAGLGLLIVDGSTNFGINTYGDTLGLAVHWLF